MLDGITKVLEEHKYRMILGISRLAPTKEIEYLSIFDDNQVEGILLLGSMKNSGLRKKISKISAPVVVLGQHVEECSCVYHDDYGDGAIVNSYLNSGEFVIEVKFAAGATKKFLPKYQAKSLQIIKD